MTSFTRLKHSRNWLPAFPISRLVFIDRASHSPHEEQPDEVLRVVRGFLSTPNPVSG